MTEAWPEVAYYYPAPFWAAGEGARIKSLLLFFDRVAILLPGYMYGRHLAADPTLAEPLSDQGLLDVFEPNTWVDQTMAEQLTTLMVDLLVSGAFEELPPASNFHELSYSRLGYGADVELSQMLVEELLARGLAEPSYDGVSVPLHPVVRTTVLVILGQLARASGQRRDLSLHPVTNLREAARDLEGTLSQSGMPSVGHVVTLDLETVTLDLAPVPLDEVLDFRGRHGDAHKTYMRDLRGFLAELALADEPARTVLLRERQQALAQARSELQRAAREAFGKNLAGWSLGAVGAVWDITQGDPFSLALTAAGLVIAALPDRTPSPSAYSYLFDAERQF